MHQAIERATETPVDYDRYRLRTFVDELDDTQIERRNGSTRLSAIAIALEGNPKAVLFEAAESGGFPLIGNALASRAGFANLPRWLANGQLLSEKA